MKQTPYMLCYEAQSADSLKDYNAKLPYVNQRSRICFRVFCFPSLCRHLFLRKVDRSHIAAAP
jgi:hypothetical protein